MSILEFDQHITWENFPENAVVLHVSGYEPFTCSRMRLSCMALLLPSEEERHVLGKKALNPVCHLEGPSGLVSGSLKSVISD